MMCLDPKILICLQTVCLQEHQYCKSGNNLNNMIIVKKNLKSQLNSQETKRERSHNNSRVQQKEESLLVFPGNSSPHETPCPLYYSPPNFLIPSKKEFFLCIVGSCTSLIMITDPKM